MNVFVVNTLFTIFSGEEVTDDNSNFVLLGVDETKKMLAPGADDSDYRLQFLAASIANLRLQQSYAAQIQNRSFYEGSLSETDKKRIITLSCAEKMMESYLSLCRDLVTASSFVFMGFGSGEAV